MNGVIAVALKNVFDRRESITNGVRITWEAPDASFHCPIGTYITTFFSYTNEVTRILCWRVNHFFYLFSFIHSCNLMLPMGISWFEQSILPSLHFQPLSTVFLSDDTFGRFWYKCLHVGTDRVARWWSLPRSYILIFITIYYWMWIPSLQFFSIRDVCECTCQTGREVLKP